MMRKEWRQERGKEKRREADVQDEEQGGWVGWWKGGRGVGGNICHTGMGISGVKRGQASLTQGATWSSDEDGGRQLNGEKEEGRLGDEG